MSERAGDAARHTGDLVSAGLVLATMVEFLPVAAALLSIVWTIIRIWETRTVQGLLGRREG